MIKNVSAVCHTHLPPENRKGEVKSYCHNQLLEHMISFYY